MLVLHQENKGKAQSLAHLENRNPIMENLFTVANTIEELTGVAYNRVTEEEVNQDV